MKTPSLLKTSLLQPMIFLILAGIAAFSAQQTMAADVFRVVHSSNMLGELEPCG